MGSLGQTLSPRHVAAMVRAMRRHHPDLLLISAEDGQKIAGHRSVLCLFSPTLAALLAEHDQGEAILKVFLEVTSIGLFAFHRCEKKRVDVGACWSRCKCLLSGLLVDEWYWLPLVVG